ncbi:hypothetical protein [Nitratireductor luteus]|uniref:hypothetical protein n=1 Tax=Nitratireductor luteus TaxID=2976980 RepID=UPI0022401430
MAGEGFQRVPYHRLSADHPVLLGAFIYLTGALAAPGRDDHHGNPDAIGPLMFMKRVHWRRDNQAGRRLPTEFCMKTAIPCISLRILIEHPGLPPGLQYAHCIYAVAWLNNEHKKRMPHF